MEDLNFMKMTRKILSGLLSLAMVATMFVGMDKLDVYAANTIPADKLEIEDSIQPGDTLTFDGKIEVSIHVSGPAGYGDPICIAEGQNSVTIAESYDVEMPYPYSAMYRIRDFAVEYESTINDGTVYVSLYFKNHDVLHQHEWTYMYDAIRHWEVCQVEGCTLPGEIRNDQEHFYFGKECYYCDYVDQGHNWKWVYNDTHHWQECQDEGCDIQGQKREEDTHFMIDGSCYYGCGYSVNSDDVTPPTEGGDDVTPPTEGGDDVTPPTEGGDEDRKSVV